MRRHRPGIRMGSLIAGLVLLPGCERAPHLASGPIDIGPRPRRVSLETPVLAAGGDWEFCFEFGRPGDSHRTGSIEVTLLSADDHPFRLTTTSLDRRGESTVCLIGRVDGLAPGVRIDALDLAAPTPLRVRHLRGGNRPRR
ncbi:MAG: hypothetical protein FD129_1840 [bacterium]|nr:MAG: hypothetical protein FD129_1840 [bacterium]